MVVKMTKWRPWPPLSSKKFDVKITVKQLRGIEELDFRRLAVEIKWKGSKGNALSSLTRSVRRNFTKEGSLRDGDGGRAVLWNEEFQSVCNLGASKDGVFQPWEVVFTVINGSNREENDKIALVATSSLNLAEFGSTPGKDVEVSIPMSISNPKFSTNASLLLSIQLVEVRASHDASEVISRSVPCLPLSPLREDKSEVSLAKTGFSKVKLFKALSTRRIGKKVHGEEEGSDGKSSTKSDDAAYVYPLDSDLSDEGEEAKDKKTDKIKKSLSYETLAHANHARGLLYSSTSCSEDEDWIYHKHRKLETGDSCYDDLPAPVSKSHQMTSPIDKILPWRRKRKESFKSLSKVKGEPLLKRHYGDEGGDDIDNDRRLLCSSEECIFALQDATNKSSISEFGDDNFAVGSWEQKEIVSRDGHMKLKTSVFFASIDQRSERAAGEGACAALVTVIADWFLGNRDHMPIKSQLDSLIREGSLDWRNLCENEKYLYLFPDKHFDLETVLQAKVRSLSVIPEKSFIGFFHPEGVEDGGFDFLHGAMSFDNIWDEISQAPVPDHEPLIYIVSWNDHFFVLKVEQDAFYIVDTLGERLFEGCNQAFILKFDRDTMIHQVQTEAQKSGEKDVVVSDEEQAVVENQEESNVVCQGKNSCKEYIKSFLAAIPLRELQVDLKKGLMASLPLHHRLQIEFHYTKFLQPVPVFDSPEATADSITECSPLEE